MRRLFRNFYFGIKNLIKWFPVIWNDRDWDDYYIFEVLKYKLAKQADHTAKHNNHTRAQYDAQRMRLCVSLLDKVQNEYYSMELYEYSDKEYVFEDCKDRPGSKTIKTKVISERYADYIKKYRSAYRRVMKMKKSHYRRSSAEGIAMCIAYDNHLRAKRLLFTILDRYIEHWWD